MIYDIKEGGKAYIAKASLTNLGSTDKEGVFFKTDGKQFLSILDNLSNIELKKHNLKTPSDVEIQFTILPLNHESDKYTHSVKVNLNFIYE